MVFTPVIRLVAIALFCLALGASPASLARSISEGCTDEPPDVGYKFTLGDLWIEAKYFDYLRIDGRTVLTQGDWKDWVRSQRVREVGLYELQNDVLVWARWTDCINLAQSQIFVLVKDGRVMANEPVWSENYQDGFYLENKSLNYWSAWFCYDDNKDRAGADQSYYYTLTPGDRRFKKVDVPYAQVCSADWRKRFNDRGLPFYWLNPDNPVTPPK